MRKRMDLTNQEIKVILSIRNLPLNHSTLTKKDELQWNSFISKVMALQKRIKENELH